MVTVESTVVTSVSAMISTGTVVILSVGVAVVDFLVSSTCFSAVAWAVVRSLTSLVTFSVNSFRCTGEIAFSVFFSLAAAVEVSSTTVVVVAFTVLGTFRFVVALVRSFVKTASFSLAAVVTGALVAIWVVTSAATAVL